MDERHLSAPPGWFADPRHPLVRLRRWDGEGWTEEVTWRLNIGGARIDPVEPEWAAPDIRAVEARIRRFRNIALAVGALAAALAAGAYVKHRRESHGKPEVPTDRPTSRDEQRRNIDEYLDYVKWWQEGGFGPDRPPGEVPVDPSWIERAFA